MSKLIICFSEIPKTFICVRVKQVIFFIWGLKKVVRLKQCPFYGFRFRGVWKGTWSTIYKLFQSFFLSLNKMPLMFFKDCVFSNKTVTAMSYFSTKLVFWSYGII